MNETSSAMRCAAAWERRPTARSAPSSRAGCEIGEFQQVSSSKHASGNQYTTLDTIRAEMDW